jgi:predicted AlkP superfamily phosphohydrolase/phosphomutase
VKLLVIGIDGIDRFIVDAMPMPFLQGLLGRSVEYRAEIDLFSRGWPEILCGRTGLDTGAFYNKPIPGKPISFSFSFNTHSYKNASVVPLWDLLGKRGIRAGFMNIPTTMPAPDLSGFFVSGGGGGFQKNGGDTVPPEACHPRGAVKILNEIGYIHDVRLTSSGIRNLDHFFDELEAMQDKHTEGFIALNKEWPVDLGFLVYLSVRDANYLAYADIDALARQSGVPANRIQARIIALYRRFDDLLKHLVNALSPRQVMVVSDHGMSPYKYDVNVNAFLERHGWHASVTPSMSVIKSIVKSAKRVIPASIRKRVTKAMPQARALTGESATDFARSQAFGGLFIPGIYVNDERYHGLVETERRDELVRQIVDAFNTNSEAKQLGMRARAYRGLHRECFASRYLPDVWIDKPDTVLFRYVGPFIGENPRYGPIASLEGLDFDNVAGTKGRHPLIYVSGDVASIPADPEGYRDLTIAYRLIDRIMTP